MDTFTPAEVFRPGEFISDELEARGWSQTDLAEIMGRPVKTINEIVSGKKTITPETAIGLAKAFGTSPELWLNLETAYRLSLAKPEGTEDVARRAQLYSVAPIKDMMRRGWIKQATDPTVIEDELKTFFGLPSLDDCSKLSFAAKKSGTYSASTPEQRAWAARVRNLGRAVRAASFTQQKLEQSLPELRRLLTSEADVRRVPAFLADIGIRFVLVEHLPRSYMDGAALWLNDKVPVIGMSARYDRIDNFWYVLCHEIMHIRFGDDESIDENLCGEGAVPTSEKPESEQRADREALDFLVPSGELEKFILRIRPLYYRTKIIQFANRLRVHPGIIVGQLQGRKELTYAQLRDLLVKVRETVKANALSDGWGFTPLAR